MDISVIARNEDFAEDLVFDINLSTPPVGSVRGTTGSIEIYKASKEKGSISVFCCTGIRLEEWKVALAFAHVLLRQRTNLPDLGPILEEWIHKAKAHYRPHGFQHRIRMQIYWKGLAFEPGPGTYILLPETWIPCPTNYRSGYWAPDLVPPERYENYERSGLEYYRDPYTPFLKGDHWGVDSQGRDIRHRHQKDITSANDDTYNNQN